MNVSKDALSAAATLERASYLTVEHPAVQAFAKFEAEITQRVRDEALEAASVKAISIGKQYGEDETGWLDCSETISTAIRQMIGGKA